MFEELSELGVMGVTYVYLSKIDVRPKWIKWEDEIAGDLP